MHMLPMGLRNTFPLPTHHQPHFPEYTVKLPNTENTHLSVPHFHCKDKHVEAYPTQGSPDQPLARYNLFFSLKLPHIQGASWAQMGVGGEMGPRWLP